MRRLDLSKNQTISYFFATLLLLSTCHAQIFIPGLPQESYQKLGDFNLGVLTSIHTYNLTTFCNDTVQDLALLQRLEAIVYAIEEINSRADLLPDHRLGYVIFDDCQKSTTALSQSLHFALISPSAAHSCSNQDSRERRESQEVGKAASTEYDTCENMTSMDQYEIIGFLGCESSETTVHAANMMTAFQIPQMSYMATTPLLSNKNKYPLFQRAVPADTELAKVILDLLVHFNWSYVSVVFIEGEYGAEGFKALEEEIRRRNEAYTELNVCFAHVREIKQEWKKPDYTNLVYELLLDKEASVVVAFIHQSEAELLMEASRGLNADGRITWIATDAWARNSKQLSSYPDEALGMFAINIRTFNVARFDEYFHNITPTSSHVLHNPWMQIFWTTYFNCVPFGQTEDPAGSDVVQVCGPDVRFTTHPTYIADDNVGLVFDALYAYAYAIHDVINGPCSGVSNDTLHKCVQRHIAAYLRRVEPPTSESGEPMVFDQNGDRQLSYHIRNFQNTSSGFRFQQLALWNSTTQELIFYENATIQWSRGQKPSSNCSSLCGVGEEEVLQQKTCCWVCQVCADNQYTSIWKGHKRCYDCDDLEWPDSDTRTECLPLVADFLAYSDVSGIVLSVLAAVGIALCLVALVLFAVNNSNHLIKASSRELSYFMLLGATTCCSLVYCYIGEASDVICFVRALGLATCLSLLYAPLLIKTIRIFRIFHSSRKYSRKPMFVGRYFTLGVTVVIVLLNVVIQTFWLMVDLPKANDVMVTPGYVEKLCESSFGPQATSLLYNLLLLVLCLAFAVANRKLPDNYNESRFICFCVYSTIILWIAFIPACLAVTSSELIALFMSLMLICNAVVVLCCIFLPKLYAVYFVHEEGYNVGSSTLPCHPQKMGLELEKQKEQTPGQVGDEAAGDADGEETREGQEKSNSRPPRLFFNKSGDNHVHPLGEKQTNIATST